MTNCMCSCSKSLIVDKPIHNVSSISTERLPINLGVLPSATTAAIATSRVFPVRASMVDSYESSSNFAKRMEQAWLISQQPRPVACTSCSSNGYVECKWCAGTGFFILGDNMLCQVPSRNTTCVICAGKGSMRCSNCKGTGFRAKWLEEPPISK
ncbi:hypothetical protein P3X46_007888 [Hevea brasiliensis]|uniref:CR-type domain-containing protein n=1 Tax=Hevea brasiliensis TaxID=3981 RepID=A0ABQ9MXX3_HEVBR|nr:protein BUNDLE SHEATH DEFECTIVE 2, chloroplastic [Hevea brasiliensis]KAJ9184116.1 hypothetical protein P3X46_007888 [Hevea brasiliensis]